MTRDIPTQSFPKSDRLLKSADFQFRSPKRIRTELFTFVWRNHPGGRLGISLSKKVLKRAVARNRVRRLLKEVFRKDRLVDWQMDLHIVGLSALKERWQDLTEEDIRSEFSSFRQKLVH